MYIYCQVDVPYYSILQFLKVVISLKLIPSMYLFFFFCGFVLLFFFFFFSFVLNASLEYNVYFSHDK